MKDKRPEIDSHVYRKLIYNKSTNAIPLERGHFAINKMVVENLYIYKGKEMNLNSFLIIYTKLV